MISVYRGLAAPAVRSLSQRTFTKTSQSLKSATELAKPRTGAVPPSAVAQDVGKSWAERHPFVFQLIVATTKTAAADLMVQMVAEGKDLTQVDWRRNGIFIVFGAAYLGGFQYWIMVSKYGQVSNDTKMNHTVIFANEVFVSPTRLFFFRFSGSLP